MENLYQFELIITSQRLAIVTTNVTAKKDRGRLTADGGD
jgi:hypothetical protein